MYSGVPMVIPDWVTWAFPLSWSRQRPKSATFTFPFFVTKMFSGFTSRWMSPTSPAAPIAAAVCRMIGQPQGQIECTLLQDVVTQIGPLHVLHRDEVDLINAAHSVYVDNVGMIELGDGRCFGPEPAEVSLVGDEIGSENFQGDRAIETKLGGQVDFAHPTSTQQFLDLEIAESDSRQVGQRQPATVAGPRECVLGGSPIDFAHSRGRP